jgi:hypothetical protein
VQTRIVDEILRLEPQERVLLLAELNDQERYVISQMLDAELTNKWAKYEHDPVGFVLDGLVNLCGRNKLKSLNLLGITNEQLFQHVTPPANHIWLHALLLGG